MHGWYKNRLYFCNHCDSDRQELTLYKKEKAREGRYDKAVRDNKRNRKEKINWLCM